MITIVNIEIVNGDTYCICNVLFWYLVTIIPPNCSISSCATMHEIYGPNMSLGMQGNFKTNITPCN